MKLPAVAMAAAFLCGIALGLCPWFAQRAASRSLLIAGFAIAGVLVFSGILLCIRGLLPLAAASSVLAWISLGVVGACLAEQPLPNAHVNRLIDAHRIDLHTPLRWHGNLRDEPAKLPWGAGY